MAKYGAGVHRRRHLGVGRPKELCYTLNGLSSNASGGIESAVAWASHVNDFDTSNKKGESMMIVSPAMGSSQTLSRLPACSHLTLIFTSPTYSPNHQMRHLQLQGQSPR